MMRGEADQRQRVGIWAQWPEGSRWSNEGVTRLLGFLIEGAAQGGNYVFRIVLPDWIRDEAEHDLASLSAVNGRDYTLHSPRDHGVIAQSMEDVLSFANAHVAVDGWLAPFPNFKLVKGLKGHVAVVFPDAIPKVLHEFSEIAWGPDGNHTAWEEEVRTSVRRADRLITFSEHVRDDQLGPIFGVDAEKVTVAPHAPPDLLPCLPGLEQRQSDSRSRAEAAQILRDHAASRGWNYLRGFPFEEASYIAVSTQDRVTKNIRLILDAGLRLIRAERRDLRILSTAPIHYGADWTPLPSAIEEALAHRDIISVPDLPRAEHAAFYHCAALAVHASVFEGGHAPFPFYEAVSVGTPCLMAHGPHVAELVRHEPEIASFVFDPNDADGLAKLILMTLGERANLLERQLKIYQRLQCRGWSDVATAYARAAIGESAQ